MLSGRVLLAHHPAEVCPALSEGLAPIEVCWVPDGFMATSEVAARHFDAILVQHPLGEMDAFLLSSWLRASGATCPIVVIADGASEEEVSQMGRQLDEGCTVVGASDVAVVRGALEMVMGAFPDGSGGPGIEGFAEMLEVGEETPPSGTRNDAGGDGVPADDVEEIEAEEDPFGETEELVVAGLELPDRAAPDLPEAEPATVAQEETATPATPAERPAAAEPPLPAVLSSFLSRRGTDRVALKADVNTRTLLGMFRLPPALTGLLDGSRSLCVVLRDSRMPPAVALDAMMRLDDAGCLGFVATRQERPPAPAVSIRQELELPPGSPDEVMALSPFQMPELLLGLRPRQCSGTVLVEGGAFAVQLTLDRGRVIAARGGPEETGLGRLLVTMGKLDADSLDRLMFESARNPEVKLEDIAVRLGWVNAAYVHAALSAQVEARIAALLPLDGALVGFYHGRAPADGGIESRPVETIVAEWLAKGGPRAMGIVRRFLHWEQRSVLRARPTVHELLPLLRLGARGQRLIRSLEGRSVRELLADGAMPREEAGPALYLLWAAGGLDLADGVPAGEPEPPPASAVRVEHTSSMPPTREAPVAARLEARSHLVERIRPPSGLPPLPPLPPSPASSVTAATGSAGSPTSLRDLPPQEADLPELLRKGREALERKDLAGAHAAFLTARALSPENPAVLVALATATFRRAPGSPVGRAEARLLLTQALTRDDGLADAYLMLGKMSRLEGDFAGARRHFDRALSLDGSNRDALGEVSAMDRLEKRVTKDVEEPAAGGGGLLGFFKRARK